MKRIVSLLCLLGTTVCLAAEPLKVVMFSGSGEYKSDDSLAKLKKDLEESLKAQVRLHITKDKGTSLVGVDDLEWADVAVCFTRRIVVPPEQVEKLKKFVAAGRGIVGIRTASHGFQTWLEFDPDVLGGAYGNHYGKDTAATLIINEKAKAHAVLATFKPFPTIGKLYKNPKLAADVTLLLTAKTPDYSEPVAWVRDAEAGKRGRVFYTSLGTPADFEDAEFMKMLRNAVKWSAGK